jgi:hypothetical protein
MPCVPYEAIGGYMARMFPERFPEDNPSEAERRVFQALRDGLSDEYTVLAQVGWLTNRYGRPRQGETDFRVVHPERGMIAIEVKGGIVDFNPAAGWSQNGRRIDSPFRQASDASHRLSDHLRVAPSTRTYHYPFGHAVSFPDADNTAIAVQLDAPEEILLGRSDLNRVERAIRSLFDYWFAHEPQPPGVGGVEALCQVLAPAGRSGRFSAKTLSGMQRRRWS